jgi:hypothetical protein
MDSAGAVPSEVEPAHAALQQNQLASPGRFVEGGEDHFSNPAA